MFVIFGSRPRQKGHNVFLQDVCGQCHNPHNMQLVEVSHWFTLFFIPIFKVMKQYFIVCPTCGAARKIPNKQAKQLIAQAKGVVPAVDRNVRAANGGQPIQQQPAQPQNETVDVKAMIKSDIDRVMGSIQNAEFLSDNSNFEKLYNSLKNGLTPKYNDPVLVEQALKEYFNI